MEENTVDLFDYLSVVWKRKILIIVVTLVGIVVGVVGVVMNSRSKQSSVVTYHADAIVTIGQRVAMSFTEPDLVSMEKPENMVEMLPLWYSEKVKEGSEYHLDVSQIGALSMLKLTLKGPDKGVGRVLKEAVDMLVDEHRKKAELSAVAYKNYIKKLEEDAKMIRENITTIESTIIKMKNKEKQFMQYMEKSGEKVEQDEYIGDRSVIWNMLYLKTIDKEIDLSRSRQSLRDIQWELLVHRTTIGNIKDYYTKAVGEIKSTAFVKPTKKTNRIIVTGVAGLVMSLFIAFFMEYIKESKSRRKGK